MEAWLADIPMTKNQAETVLESAGSLGASMGDFPKQILWLAGCPFSESLPPAEVD
jgi:hypothetical protein